MNIRLIQKEHKKWELDNFGTGSSHQSLLGIMEELGELCHAYLKREQKIRGTEEVHIEEIKDAIGDIVIFLIGFCNRENLDFQSIVADTWEEVKNRDWTKYKRNGVTK